ncbi:hypothetical protein [Streptomyces sp. NPDC014746]|uniref:hypothetical protein n=1 Tax=Streptomyces sp. NPDC014746 TaxID=3364904 RepID=UPI0037013D4B
MTPEGPPKLITRRRDGQIHAYVVDREVFGELEPAAVFRPRPGDEVVDAALWPDLGRVVYTTLNGVVCLGRDGVPVWTTDFGPPSDRQYGHRPSCAVSLDGRTVWVYRPDAMAGRGDADAWIVHDAGSGAVVARRELGTVGHGAGHHVHPADGSVYLDIGEGQDGAVVLRGAATAGGGAEFVTYPWWDRCLIDLAPDGEQFMTVDHGQGDVAFHGHPDGEVLVTLPVEAFGHDPEASFVEWTGGYLTADLAVVTLAGEGEDGEEWFRHHLVDVRTGKLRGEIPAEGTDPYALVPLGDGSWLTGGRDEAPVRHSYAPAPSGPPYAEG